MANAHAQELRHVRKSIKVFLLLLLQKKKNLSVSEMPVLQVLITRPRDEAQATADRITAAGYEPVIAPFMHVRFTPTVAPPGTQAILVTSGNALPGLAASAMPLLAVGDATAARARHAGFTTVLSANGDAAALAQLVCARLDPNGGPLLLACGRGQGAPICNDLRRAGFRVHRRVTYAAVPVTAFPPAAESALRGGQVHAAIFLSGQTAATFARLLPSALTPRLGNVFALAIGKTAADALNHLPWRQVRLARNPTLDDVLAQL
jgi:uroporphyrinogen-III synthase